MLRRGWITSWPDTTRRLKVGLHRPTSSREGHKSSMCAREREREKQALAYSDIFSPQSLNKYQYCLKNPLRYIDPDGHDYRIVEEKDSEGKKIKRYVWDRDYTYKKGDKNGAPSNAQYIDTQGRAIQLWGDNSKDPKKEQDHGYQVVEPGTKREEYVSQQGEAPTSFVSYADTERALLNAGYKEHHLDPHPDHWGGNDFSKPTSPTLHITLFPNSKTIVGGKTIPASMNQFRPLEGVTWHNEKHTQAGTWGDLGRHLKDFFKQ